MKKVRFCACLSRSAIKSQLAMKAGLVLLMPLLLSELKAQTSFNVRVSNMEQLVFESVHVLNDGYLAVGVGYDTVGSYHIDMFTYVFDDMGNVLSTEHYGEANAQIYATGNSISDLPNQFVQTTYTLFQDTTRYKICWLSEQGDTTFSRLYYSPYWQSSDSWSNYVLPYFSYLCEDSTVYFAGLIGTSTAGNDAVLYKLDPLGNELWHYVHATQSDPDVIYGLEPHQGGVITAITQFIYAEDSTNVLFKKFDASGNEHWTIDSNEFTDDALSCNSILIDDDTIVGCGKILPYSINNYYPIASVFKIDTLGELIWSNTFGDYNEYEPRDFFTIVRTTDGHYVCGGTWSTAPGSEEILEGQTNPDYDQFAHIVKFDHNTGEIIWERKYRWLETYRDNHTLHDMKATPDGGIIFCGEANDPYHFYDPPYQQAWVVKLDACGCLVPGCDENCVVGTTENVAVNQQRFKVGPNPANDFLNVYVSPHALTDFHQASFVLYDLRGRVVKSFSARQGDTTYILDVAELSAGRYQLVLQNDGMAVETMAVEIVH